MKVPILRILNSLQLLYVLMLWPARYAIWDFYDGGWYYAQIMYDTGIWSVRLLILTVSVTPGTLLINRLGLSKTVGRWLLQRRRHFGLGSFLYGALHLIHYLIETDSVRFVLVQSVWLEYAAGWLAFLIFFGAGVDVKQLVGAADGSQLESPAPIDLSCRGFDVSALVPV
ncbi:MAG: hypothetical protein ABJI96_21280 [Paracoccaceae bacterium]